MKSVYVKLLIFLALISGVGIGLVIDTNFEEDKGCSSIGVCVGDFVISNDKYTNEYGLKSGKVVDIRGNGNTLVLKTDSGEYVFLDDVNSIITTPDYAKIIKIIVEE